MIIYFIYLLLCFIGFVSIILYVAINYGELKLKLKHESRRIWMIMKTLTDGQATKDLERELSCCGFNNALDYCDRKLQAYKYNENRLQNMAPESLWTQACDISK